MDLKNRSVALYGKFSPGNRDRLQRQIERRGGSVARDLTRQSERFVVGALATSMIDSGALMARIKAARTRDVPIQGERGFSRALGGEDLSSEATLPLAPGLAQSGLDRDDADILAVFDLIVVADDKYRFGDAGALRVAGELMGQGQSRSEVVRILAQARDLAPVGRHKIVLTVSGVAALQWDNGLTTLEGQGYLPLDEDHASLEDLFEGAAIAEAGGDLGMAARLYDTCARADRSDPIAPYNYANIRVAEGAYEPAILAYRQALAREQKFIEARYNLSLALEAAGKTADAVAELDRVLLADPSHADALFNLAQLQLKAGKLEVAKGLYEQFLRLEPQTDWAATARKALAYCVGLLTDLN